MAKKKKKGLLESLSSSLKKAATKSASSRTGSKAKTSTTGNKKKIAKKTGLVLDVEKAAKKAKSAAKTTNKSAYQQTEKNRASTYVKKATTTAKETAEKTKSIKVESTPKISTIRKRGGVVLSGNRNIQQRREAQAEARRNLQKSLNVKKGNEKKYESKETDKYKKAIDEGKNRNALGTRVKEHKEEYHDAKTGVKREVLKGMNAVKGAAQYEETKQAIRDYYTKPSGHHSSESDKYWQSEEGKARLDEWLDSAEGQKAINDTIKGNVEAANKELDRAMPSKLKYSYKDLTQQEYTRLATASQTGQLDTLLKSDKDLAKKVADLNVKDYVKGAGAMGFMDQMTQGLSVSQNPVYKYSDGQKQIMERQKQTTAYNVGRFAGAAAEFGLSGTGAMGSALAKTGGKAVLKEAAKSGTKNLIKTAGKNTAKETGADALTSLPLNILDAVKDNYVEGSKKSLPFEWSKVAGDVVLNTVGDVVIGGVTSGITHGLSAKQASRFNAINKKAVNGKELTEAEWKFYDKHVNELGDKVREAIEGQDEQVTTAKRTGTLTDTEHKQYIKLEARRRAGVPLSEADQKTLDNIAAKAKADYVKNAEQKAMAEARKPYTAQVKAATSNENVRLTEADLEDYITSGNDKALHKKAKISGDMILKNDSEIESYIKKSLSEDTGEIRAYAVVGKRFIDDVLEKTNGDIDLTGKWMELPSQKIKHAKKYHTKAKRDGDLPLRDEDFYNIANHMDNYDDIMEVVSTSQGVRIKVGKKVNGYSVITEMVSDGRNSVKFENMWRVETGKYFIEKEKSLRYQVSPQALPGNSYLSADRLSTNNISNSVENVNPKEAEIQKANGEPFSDTAARAYANPGKQYDTMAESIKAESGAYTAEGVRETYEREKKGDFTPGENDMQFAGTLWKSEECTDDALRAELENMTESGLFRRPDVISNEKALEIGRERVSKDANGCMETFVNNVNDGKKLTKQDFATATELLIHYKNTGDVANWKKVARAMAQGYSDAGQILQSARMVRRLTPQGRATQALKIAEQVQESIKKSRGKELNITLEDETIERILRAQTDEELTEAFKAAKVEIWNQVPASAMEKLQALQRMAMLGNPKTMIRNVVGNFIFKPFRMMSGTLELGFQKMGAKQLERMDSGRTKKLVKAEDREAYKGFKQYAADNFDRFYNELEGDGKYVDSYGRPNEAKTFKHGAIQKTHDLVMEGLEKGDMLLFKPEFKNSFAQYCYARGIDPETMTKSQMDKAVKHAMDEAKYATYRNDSALASLLSRKHGEWMTKKGATKVHTMGYRAGAMIMQTMLPFKKTPINIAKAGLDYTPLGLARGIIRNIEAVRKTGDADMMLKSYKEMASGLTGTGVMALGMYMFSTGIVTVKAGNWSTDEWYDKDMGNQDYSLKIGDRTYSLSWCAPLNMPFIMGAALQESIEDHGLSLEAGLNILNGMVDPFFELSFAQNMKDFLLENDSMEDYLADLSVMPLQYACQLIPSMSSQFATVLDDWQRDTTSYAEGTLTRAWEKEFNKAVNKIPVLREKWLEPRVDRYGDYVPSSAGENAFEKAMITFLSVANIKDITMNEEDRYIIGVLQNTSNEKTREKIIPTTGSFWTGREDGKSVTPQERTKYQVKRGKEYRRLVKEQRTATYQNDLSKKQRQNKLIKTKYAAVTYSDAETYGYKYALKAEDLRGKSSGYESNTYGDFKNFKKANPEKTAKDYFNAYYAMKTTSIHAGDNEYATQGLALYKIGADDATYRHFGVDIEKREVFTNYLGDLKGSESEYYEATNAIERKANKRNGGKLNKLVKTMTLAQRGDPDRVYYAVGVLGDDHETMHLGRGLVEEGFTVASILKIKEQSKAYNEDGKGNIKRDEAIDYVESLGLESTRQKALVFAAISDANNPYGSIGTYTVDGDVMGAAATSGGSYGRRSGSSSKPSNMPTWEEYVKDYMTSIERESGVKFKSWDSPLDQAYRNKINNILKNTRS